jgi:transaldolase
MKIDIYADIIDHKEITDFIDKEWIKGFTTNPTLIRKGGAKDYLAFAEEAAKKSLHLPISLEVIADDFDGMYRQAKILSELGSNIYVKIPVTNTKGESTLSVINQLVSEKVNLNITAIMTISQIELIRDSLPEKSGCILSVFAGRIADTGIDPVPFMEKVKKTISTQEEFKLLWASPREILNLIQAEKVGCDIITASSEILKKIDLIGKNLNEFSIETVQMFRSDALAAGYDF